MKVLLAAAGYPPDVRGGTERSVQSLARGLARAGRDVVVVAGSDDWKDGFRVSAAVDRDPVSGRQVRVHRIHRDDLFYEHWQKSLAPRVGRAFEQIVRAERPTVVHVHHWLRLTRDLVYRATALGCPTVLSLHDYAPSCLIVHRVRPRELSFCRSALAADPCLRCAQSQRPATPFVTEVEQTEALWEFRRIAQRELRTAGRVLVLSRDQQSGLEELLGPELRSRALGIGVDLEEAEARRLPPPSAGTQRLVIGTWGSLHRIKGVDLMLDAVQRLEPDLRPELHVAGVEVDPEFKSELVERSKGLPVRFHGAFAPEGLATHEVTRVHAAVHGTRARETWGITVDEAMALGLPLVLPRIGAFLERIPEGSCAEYYTQGDAADLARTLALLQDAERLPKLRARLPAARAAIPSVDQFVGRVVEVYEAVVAEGVRPVVEFDEAAQAAHERRMAEWDRACAAYLRSLATE